MSMNHTSRLKKLEAVLRPPAAAPRVAFCWDKHPGSGEPVPCAVGGEWFAMDELPADVDTIFHMIRDAEPAPSR